MRSEFEEASHHLNNLIEHTRKYHLFNTYSARITLHHAHLAHSLGDIVRASKCYAVAAHLAAEGTFVNVSARAGGLALRIAQGEDARTDLAWEAEVSSVVEACKGMGGTLEAIGHILQACLSSEILTAKYTMIFHPTLFAADSSICLGHTSKLLSISPRKLKIITYEL